MFGTSLIKSKSITAIMAGALMFSGATGVLAQDNESDMSDVAHPAHIHNGTCDDLDPNPAQPLNDITPYVNEDDDDEDANNPQGTLTAPMMLRSETDVEMSLDDILSESHAINIHESADNIQNYIACGDIGGIVVDEDGGTLPIAISPLNDSGIYGVAFLTDDGDNTNVKVWLAESRVEDEATATPMS